MATTLKETLAQLEALGNEKVRKHNRKYGAADKQFGVPAGDIRKLAAKIKMNHALALALWKTGNTDAQLLAILLIDLKELSGDQLDRLVRTNGLRQTAKLTVGFSQVADWLHSYVIKNHPDKESLRQKWMAEDDPWALRAGWQLTAGRVAKSPEGLDLPALLDRIESEMGNADPVVQWTMNSALAEIGIHFPKLRKQALAIGEKLGIYRDYPCSKGCTSPFAPIWINEMVRRQGLTNK
ncbi:MAG TPA: DNA alkylation repair protein [Gemmataceae bacterium]|nr:DNA alkylation repair protein [Gemmataceae bacterium]